MTDPFEEGVQFTIQDMKGKWKDERKENKKHCHDDLDIGLRMVEKERCLLLNCRQAIWLIEARCGWEGWHARTSSSVRTTASVERGGVVVASVARVRGSGIVVRQQSDVDASRGDHGNHHCNRLHRKGSDDPR